MRELRRNATFKTCRMLRICHPTVDLIPSIDFVKSRHYIFYNLIRHITSAREDFS
jgi:hypothetical protein